MKRPSIRNNLQIHTGYQPLQQVIITPTDPIDGARTSIVAKAAIGGDFGLIENSPITTGSATYNYKYNGKELQEEFNINLYDYGARNYDSAIGRWFNIDPLAEKFINATPYNYVLNNPVNMIDPDGMEAQDLFGNNRYNQNGMFIPPHERGSKDGNDEPPFNFLPKFENIYQAARNKTYNEDDGIFSLFSHANPHELHLDINNKIHIVKTPEELNEILKERYPNWKESMDKKQNITLILYACGTGADFYVNSKKDIYDVHKNGRKNFAERFTEAFPNVTVFAPSGDVYSGIKNKVNQFTGSSFYGGLNKSDWSRNGGWWKFQNGKKVSDKLYKASVEKKTK